MSKESYLTQLLKSKLPDSSEIEIHFFELCNLRCHFCGQDHEDKTGLSAILEKLPRVLEFIETNHQKSHILNLMGGELFNDELPDEIFKDYLNFAKAVFEKATSLGHTVHINWVTNLIFKKHQRVTELLNNCRAWGLSTKLSSSYDFTGRRNKYWDCDLFLENLKRFKDDIFTVGFVLTKPAIHKLLLDDDEVFHQLYSHYPLYFDYYVPEAGAQLLMPSDQEILNALLFLAKKYPQISPVEELLNNQNNKMTCYSLNKLTLLPDGKEVKCRYLKYSEGQFKTPIDYQSNENIVENFVEENQCLSCEWFEKCSFRCFVQADWAKREKLERCLFKTFFEKTSEIPK